MRLMAGVLIGLAMSSSAFADLSDSGNLTIGGQAVIAGSATVQGSAFSVGGSTFSVNGGSITLGGRLNAAAAGIRWADGSTSTTAATAGLGGGTAVSTFTLNAMTSWTMGDSLACVPGSTLTWTADGSSNYTFYSQSTGNCFASVMGTILLDGANLAGNGLNIGQCPYNGSAELPNPLSMVWTTTTPPSLGSHSVCVAWWAPGGATGHVYGPGDGAGNQVVVIRH